MSLENMVSMKFNKTITRLNILIFLTFFCDIFALLPSTIISISDYLFIGRKSDGALGYFEKDCVEELPGN